MSRAIKAAPASDRPAAVISQISQVRLPTWVKRALSIRIQ